MKITFALERDFKCVLLNGEHSTQTELHPFHINEHCQNHGPWSTVHAPCSMVHMEHLTDASASSSDDFECSEMEMVVELVLVLVLVLVLKLEMEMELLGGSVNCTPIECCGPAMKSFQLSRQVSLNVWVA